jgi:alkanesulfonate monooxygenase SsuD/methylene tetrahydromethanopterin reductase-like flavin-dependent oxidoreductase (luciferase family)
VDETDEKALAVGLNRASRAYEGFLPPPQPGETFEQRVREHAKKFIGRGEPGASEIMANLFDADYLMKHELVFIGSPETVAKKIHAAAQAGLFNVLMGEFNYSDLPEGDLLRSIRLFGEKVIPALRDYEPF